MKGRNRKEAYSPKSSGWTLYKPEVLAERLKLPVEQVDVALEETGFNKAVRIREEMIKAKTLLIQEQREVNYEIQQAIQTLTRLRLKNKELAGKLLLIRDILRIPREKEGR